MEIGIQVERNNHTGVAPCHDFNSVQHGAGCVQASRVRLLQGSPIRFGIGSAARYLISPGFKVSGNAKTSGNLWRKVEPSITNERATIGGVHIHRIAPLLLNDTKSSMLRGMAQLDLKPTEYRKQNPRSGRWQFRDNPRLCFVMMLVALALLAWVFTLRHEASPEALFAGVFVFSFGAGGMFALWLKDR